MSALSRVKQKFPSRNEPIDQIFAYISLPQSPVFICGPKGSGKSSIWKDLVTELDLTYAWINCNEMYSNKLLFEEILSQLKIDEDVTLFGCSDILSFLNELKSIIAEKCFTKPKAKKTKEMLNVIEEGSKTKCFLIFDNVETFLKDEVSIVSMLNRVNELTQNVAQIGVIYISSLPSETYYHDSGHQVIPNVIEFPAYSKDELSVVLMKDLPESYGEQFYSNYIQITLSIFYGVTRNVNELKYACKSNFEKYIEPIENGTLKQNDAAKLWRNFEPHLKRAFEKFPVKIENRSLSNHDLPFCSKILLIASYLASYNSEKSDRRFFVKYQGKRKNAKRRQPLEKHFSGPHAFTFERMFHIYKAIMHLSCEVEEDDFLLEASVQLLSQVETLISLRLIHRQHTATNSNWLASSTKLKAAESLSLEFITEIAKTVKFELIEHMERFVTRQ